MPINQIINSFNAGELSPYLRGRTDIAKYSQGCKTLENMFVLPYGGVLRRPGTEYISDVKTHSKKVRLVPFEFNITQAYMLEFGDQYIRFYKDGGQITSLGSTYEISSPYLESELFDIQFVQSADVMYLAHGNHRPYKLSRTAHDNWTLEAIEFDYPVFLDENIESTTIATSATSGNGITLTASASLFNAGHVGSYWKISHIRDDNQITGSYTSTTTSSSIECRGSWNFVTHNTWDGTVVIERSFDGGTSWQVHRTYSSASDRNVDISGEETGKDVLYRVRMSVFTSGTLDFEFTVQDYWHNGVVKITAVASGTSATANVIHNLAKTNASKYWSEGAWSDYQGYPACVAIYQERLYLAGTTKKPQTVWGPIVNDWEDFAINDFEDSAVSYTLAADKVNAIRWLCPQSSLMIGTAGGEWKMQATNKDEPLSPSNINIERQSTYGSKLLQAVLVNDVVLFIQRQGRKVREFTYNFEKDGWVSPDLSILAEHITDSGIVNIAYQQQPHQILWCIRDDGVLVGMTYERTQSVVGWHRHVTDGEFESVAIIPGDDEDEIWISVKRTISGSTKRYIERFKPLDFDSLTDCFFVDSGLSWDGGTNPITNISQATQALVTSASHGLSSGNHVKIKDVSGMTDVNDRIFSVDVVEANTYKLKAEDGSAYLDSSDFSAYTSGGTAYKVSKTFSLLDHLEGKELELLADGASHDSVTVSGGSVTLDRYANKVIIGLPYTPTLEIMPLDVQTPTGTSQGRPIRITELVVRFYRTLTARAGYDSDNLDEIYFRTSDDAMGAPPSLFTGDKEHKFTMGNKKEGKIMVTQNKPMPLTILSVIPRYEVSP